MKRFRLIMVAIVSLLILIVVLQNTQSVETKVLFATITMPRALLLLITFLAGGITGLVVAIQMRGRQSAKN